VGLLEINNLTVEVEDKTILKKVDLNIEKGEKHVILGANASGKSTLLHTLIGFPDYYIKKGNIIFKGKDITNLEIEERAQEGIAAVYQNPPAINVKLSSLLDQIRKKDLQLKGIESLLERKINVGFSGGERKLSELAQVISLEPELIILDELDSGLDVENLEKLSTLIKKEIWDKTIILITHRGEVLNFFEPDIAHVMLDGEIICSSDNWKKIWKTIEEDGYAKCRTCELPSKR
jgi:Fe-S cluster assembly ATP-binding protein